jgi:tetratricopeptide (TPR) repeat protein
MTRLYCIGILLLTVGLAGAQTTARESAMEPATASRIASAKAQISKNPAQPDGYTQLALALVKAARATDRAEHLKQAEQAVADALRLAPDDFEAHKAEVAIRMAEARYAEALEEAKALNKKVPDDNQMYGYIADAEMALGDYTAAEKATQWMIDQRPVNAPGLQRGARLREILGYNEPALEWWNSSLRITSSSDSEERAWILVNMSRVDLAVGKPAEGEKCARQALELAANYPWANDALAEALMEQDQAGAAAEVLARRLTDAPNLAAKYHLATALEAAGKKTEAEGAWRQFEREAAARVARPDNANRELIEYYATHDRSDDAVKLASAESRRQQDIATLAAYASALASAGKYDEARIQMDRALAPGIRDATLFYRAGTIAIKLNDKAAAAKYLKKAIEINASSPEAGKAIKLLANLS